MKLQQDAADAAVVSQGKYAGYNDDTANVNALMVFQAAGSFCRSHTSY